MSDVDPVTAAIQGAIAEATPEPEAVETETESAAETADVAEGSADIEDGQEAAAEGEEPKAGTDEPKAGTPEPPKKKRGPIPYDRHEAVLTKARNEAKAQQEELNKRIEALAKYESDEYQAQFRFLELIEKDPARAVAILRQVDPQRYANLTWAEQVAQAKAEAKTATEAAPVGEKPQPDTLLPDGTLGYSAEGAEKLLQWQLAQEREVTKAEFEKFRKEFAPVRTEHEARVAYTQAVSKMKPVLEDARKNWPGFTENEGAIREALDKNPTFDLNAAYRSVVIPTFMADKTKIEADTRKRILEEMAAKRKTSTLTPGQVPAAGAADDDKPRDTEDIIRESLRSVKQ